MQLLNTKALLVIAALLASILGILTQQQRAAAREEQRKAELLRLDKERWDQVREEQKRIGPIQMEQAIKNHKPY